MEASQANIAGRKMSWLTPLHPFLALDVALNRVYAPPEGRLTDHSAMVRYALAYPAVAYVLWTTAMALILTVLSIFFVRRGATLGERTIFTAISERLHRPMAAGQSTRTLRAGWTNPVAWREAKTRAAGGGALRWAIIAGGLFAYLVLFAYHATGAFSAAEVADWLAALTIIQFALVLIIATNTAATSITKERESLTLDLTMTTRLPSKYNHWGKLLGLMSSAAPRPTMDPPRITPVAGSERILTNPRASPSMSALALVENGTLVTASFRPAAKASASAIPTSAISGSVKMDEAAFL